MSSALFTTDTDAGRVWERATGGRRHSFTGRRGAAPPAAGVDGVIAASWVPSAGELAERWSEEVLSVVSRSVVVPTSGEAGRTSE